MNNRPYQESGFTLLEIMLVIFLMGVMASGVVMTMNAGGADAELKKHASRFVGLLELAEEEALLRSLELGLVIEDQSYQFVYLDDKDKWQALTEDKFFTEVTLPDDMQLGLKLAGLKAESSLLGSHKLFADDDDSLFEDNGSLFADEDDSVRLEPEIFIYSSGEISDFQLAFSYIDTSLNDRTIRVAFDEYGSLQVEVINDDN